MVAVGHEGAVDPCFGTGGVLLRKQYLRFHGVAVGVSGPFVDEHRRNAVGTLQAVEFDVAQHPVVPRSLVLRLCGGGFGIVGCSLGKFAEVDA